MKRTRQLSRWTLAASVAVTIGCGSGMQVRTDYDPAVSFGGYTTFAVLEEAGDNTAPGFMDARIKTAIAQTVSAKGWRQVDSPDQADVTIGYQLTTEQRSTLQTVNTGWGSYGYGWGGWYDPYMGGGMSTSTTTESRYEVGTLIIAMFDQERKEMIYTSTASGKLDERQVTPDEAQAEVNDVVERMLKDFPPGG